MAKLIAICGAPGSGKTTVAFKLAQEIYLSTSDCSVTFLSPDIIVPSVGMLFPNYTPDSLFSLSAVLDCTDISDDLIMGNLVTVKNMKNFGCLGFMSGDSKYSFPTPTKEKVMNLLDVLSAAEGYVFVDCSNDDSDLISKQAIARADHIIQVITPDLKSMTWLNSYGDKITAGLEQCIKVVNITENELYIPLEDVCTHLKNVACVLPYCRQVRQQLLDGRMYDRLNAKEYKKRLSGLVNRVI
jgi:CO dehydrogenase nickel-insertion accessory protein CooC1